MTTQPTVETGRAEQAYGDTEPTAFPRSPRAVVAALVAFAVVARVGLWAVGLATTGYALRFSHTALLVWARWDAPHYLHVATGGYVGRGPNALWIVFFPLYPVLVHVAAWVFGNAIVSALVVSLVASVAAGFFLYKLAALGSPPDEAWRSVVLLFAFPTAYFLAAPYSEGVFMAAIIASIYAARRDRWGWAALAGAAATASRLTGLAIVPALAVEALRSTGSSRLRRLGAAALSASGFVIYLGLNRSIFGHPLEFMKIERGRPWYQQAVPPWHPLVEAVAKLGHRAAWNFWFVYPARLAAFVLAAGLLVWGWRRLRASDHAFAWTALAMSLSGARLISLPRYILGLYPILIVAAWKLRSRLLFWAVVGLGLAAQGYLFSRYARGLWAF